MEQNEQLAVLLASDPCFDEVVRLSDELVGQVIDAGIDRLFGEDSVCPEIKPGCDRIRSAIKAFGLPAPDDDLILYEEVAKLIALRRRWRVL